MHSGLLNNLNELDEIKASSEIILEQETENIIINNNKSRKQK